MTAKRDDDSTAAGPRVPGSRGTGAAEIDRHMLELLVCPLTRGPLTWDRERSELRSRLGRLAYPVRDGIPILLTSEARQFDDEE